MKVASGIYGGRKLYENTFQHIRPTADIVKQAMFNKLAFKVANARVLDLFCGTGALGIEAISRGAKEVVFVDKDKRSVDLTLKNLKNLKINAKVLLMDYEKALKSLAGQFDIIILDPPYMAGLYENCLKIIYELNLLADDGIIVCEHQKDNFDLQSPFTVESQKRYGIKMLTYLIK